jgi:Lrp/AsnC family leucine-responsive transcriptional regulator
MVQQNGCNFVAIHGYFRQTVQLMSTIDQIDRNILRVLSRDGRISNVDLAERVNLSPSACLRRVQDLERSGVIVGYRAVLDQALLGKGFLAYVAVGLSRHSKATDGTFERSIAAAEEVRECHAVTGGFEYLLRAEVRDLAAYKHFHTEVLGALPHVASITSYVVMGSPKDERG